MHKHRAMLLTVSRAQQGFLLPACCAGTSAWALLRRWLLQCPWCARMSRNVLQTVVLGLCLDAFSS